MCGEGYVSIIRKSYHEFIMIKALKNNEIFPFTEVVQCVVHSVCCGVTTVVIMSKVSNNTISEGIYLMRSRCQTLCRGHSV